MASGEESPIGLNPIVDQVLPWANRVPILPLGWRQFPHNRVHVVPPALIATSTDDIFDE